MSVTVSNFFDGSNVTYSLPILSGEVKPFLSNSIEIVNTRSNKCMLWPVVRGRFKAVVELVEGENVLQFKYYGEIIHFSLVYRIPPRRKFVRCVYIICADDENKGHFQAPPDEDSSPESAAQRLFLASKLLQSFTAEKLYEHNLGRKTFALENDLDSTKPGCYIYNSNLTLAKALTMSAHELWTYFAKELMVSKFFTKKSDCKWLVFMSFTRYIPPEEGVPNDHSETLQYTKGHAALGGGGLALFGTGNLHCWAVTMDEFVARFTDARKIDRKILMDDSAYREYYWANYATGLGASLHELGHTFDLCHTSTGIMARGFDDIYRTFVLHSQSQSDSYGSGISNGSSRCSSAASSPSPYITHVSPFSNEDNRFEIPQPLSRPHDLTMTHVETAFQMLSPLSSQQVQVIRNYDGSETKRTTKRNRNGTESISEMTYYGKEVVIREILNHEATGRSKLILSMSVVECGKERKNLKVETSNQDKVSGLSPVIPSTYTRFRDGGAHWHRSSAVLLTGHKWFNDMPSSDSKAVITIDGTTVKSEIGLWLIELRSIGDSSICHHWEFHGEPALQQFELMRLPNYCNAAEEVIILAQDVCGNILKEKISIGK